MDLNDINIEEITLVKEGASAEKDDVKENIDGEQSGEKETTDVVDDTATNSEDPDSASKEEEKDNGDEKPLKEEKSEPTVDVEAQIKERLDDRVESLDAIPSLLDELDQLREASKKEPELVFPTDRAKKAYEFLISNEGEFKELSTQIHHVLALGDPTKMDDKRVQLEAFKLERKDLTTDKAETLFNARYEKLYGEMEEDDVLLQDEHGQQTKSAIDTIRKMQDSVNVKENAEQEEAEDQKVKDSIDVAKTVDKTLQGYKGIDYAFGEDGEDKLTISPEDDVFKSKEDAKSFSEQLKDGMVNPASIIENAIEGMKDKDGNLDWNAYADFVMGIMAPDKIRQKLYDQGLAAGQASKLKESKNQSDSKLGDKDVDPAKESYYDVWGKAASN